MSSGYDALVCRSVVVVDTFYLALFLGNASKCVEARGGTTNIATDSEILPLI